MYSLAINGDLTLNHLHGDRWKRLQGLHMVSMRRLYCHKYQMLSTEYMQTFPHLLLLKDGIHNCSTFRLNVDFHKIFLTGTFFG